LSDIDDFKDFKKLLRTKTNVLVLFIEGAKSNSEVIRLFDSVSEQIKGQGTMVQFDCSSKEIKKICKKLKANPQTYQLKHFHNGDFHKDYDRLLKESSMINFMRDPAGDMPWDEEVSDVVHLADYGVNSQQKN
jgi:hypothetical protein